MDTDTLLRLARMYAAHRKLKLSTLATYAVNDGKFFKSLAAGGGCTLRRAARAVEYFNQNWPADLEWPRDITRPAKPKKEAP